jgi:hypothetical protein
MLFSYDFLFFGIMKLKLSQFLSEWFVTILLFASASLLLMTRMVYVLALQVDGMIIPGSTATAWLQKCWKDGEFGRGQITGL